MNSDTYAMVEAAGLVLELQRLGGIHIDESIPTGVIRGRKASRAVMGEGAFRHQFHSGVGLAARKAKRKAARVSRKKNRK